MSASADVLAQAKVEIDLAAIPEGKNVRLCRSPFFGHEPIELPPFMWPCYNIRLWPPKYSQMDQLGNHQMARQTSLHPPPHRRRDQRRRRHEMGITARPSARQRSSQEARMVDHAR